MKRNAQKLLALVIGLALVMSMFAMAEDGAQEVIDLGGEIVIDDGVGTADGTGTAGGSGTAGETQGEADALEIELDAGEGLPDGEVDPAGTLDLGLDLNGTALESNAEAPAPVTGEAMLAGNAVDVGNWRALSDNLGGGAPSGESQENPTCYRLTADVIAQQLDSSIKVASGRHVVLDLNGHAIDRNLWSTINDGYVIGVWGDLTLKGDGIIQGGNNNFYGGGVMVAEGAAFTMQGGTIRNNRAVWGGGGVYVVRATFTMQGGKISGNKASDTGGGVYNDGTFTMLGGIVGGDEDADGNSADYCGGVYNSGTFTMQGGRISRNRALTMLNAGGGVYSDSTFNMQGGTISENYADRGGGVCVGEKGTFNLSDNGTISHNQAHFGGGVYNDGTFNMLGGTICDNTAKKFGAGVDNIENFTMQGGTICNNTAESGGGVYTSGHFTLQGGEICKNTASLNGGGVQVNAHIFTMVGGKIHENNGDGVYTAFQETTFEMYSGEIIANTGVGVHSTCMIRLAGTVSISDNNRNLLLKNDTHLYLGDDLKIDKPIGVSYEEALSGDTEFTRGFGKYSAQVNPAEWFTSEQDGLGVYLNTKTQEAMLCKVHKVAFDANGGEGGMAPLLVRPGETGTLGGNTFTRKGHYFVDWNTQADGKGTQYADKASITPSGNMTLYAQWELRDIEVQEFDVRGYRYTGKPIEPEVKATDKRTQKALVKDVDFTVRYENNVNVGDPARAIITFIGDYEGVPEQKKIIHIIKKHITVTADDKAKVQGQPDPELTYVVEGLVEGDTLSGKLAREPGEVPGDYKITRGTLKNTNYEIDFVGARFTIIGSWDLPRPTVTPDVALLARMTVSGSGKTALRVAWTKVAEADGYDVYFARCGRDYSDRPRASVTGCCVRVSGLKARTEYKAYVRAWTKDGGEKVYLGDSPEVHAITGGYDASRCNAQSVRLNRSSVTLKAGRSATLKATVKGVKSGRKVLAHVRKVRWYSSNINVATVSSNGRIKATGAGSCTVWAIANNGVRASVKVVVRYNLICRGEAQGLGIRD